MGYRRSKLKAQATLDWDRFVTNNKEVIRAAGLPELLTQSIRHWDDFLLHGYLDHHDDPSGFTVREVSEEQYRALLQVVESYFAMGYEYYTPIALRSEDQQILYDRFGGR